MTDIVLLAGLSVAVLMLAGGVVLIVSSLENRDRLKKAQDSGVWYGTDEPPEGFRGYWHNGRVHQVYPMDVKVSHLTAEEIADLEED